MLTRETIAWLYGRRNDHTGDIQSSEDLPRACVKRRGGLQSSKLGLNKTHHLIFQ